MEPVLNNCQFRQLDALIDSLTMNEDTYTLYISDLLVLSKFFDNEVFTFDEIENLFLGVWAEKMQQNKRLRASEKKRIRFESGEQASSNNHSISQGLLLKKKVANSRTSSKTISQNSLLSKKSENEVFPVQDGIITMRKPLILEPKNEQSDDGFEFWNEIQSNPDMYQPFLKIGRHSAFRSKFGYIRLSPNVHIGSDFLIH